MSDLGNKDVMARNLRRLLNETGKTRSDICHDLKIGYSTFTEWYNGNKYPRIDKIELMANYFGVQKSDLIENPKTKAPDGFDSTHLELISLFSRCTKEQQDAFLALLRSVAIDV